MGDAIKTRELPSERELLEAAAYASREHAIGGRGCMMIGFHQPHLQTHPWIWVPAADAARYNMPVELLRAIDNYNPVCQAVIVVMTENCLKILVIDVSGPVAGTANMN